MKTIAKANIHVAAWVMLLLLSGCSKNEDPSKTGAGGSTSTGTGTSASGSTSTGTVTGARVKCAPGYTCYSVPQPDVVWVMKDDGNVNGPSCKDVCEGALSQNCDYRACDGGRPVEYPNMDAFAPIAAGLGGLAL